jgi:DNA-binding transcriptional MerR regulator
MASLAPDLPQFFVADIAAAAEIDTATLQNWIKRGLVAFAAADRAATGSGSRRLFTLQTALQIAMMAELVRNGLAIGRATQIAAKFSPRRSRAYPAIVVVPPGAPFVTEARRSDIDGLDRLFDLVDHGGKNPDIASMVLIDLDRLEGRVRTKLGCSVDP